MRFKHMLAAAAAASMTAVPVMAAPTNPAAPLSIDAGARAGSAAKDENELSTFGGGFGGILAAIIVAGVIAIVVIEATNSDDDPDSP